MDENKFKCSICNKYYKSYKSLWNHNKQFHTQKSSESNPIVTQSNPKVTRVKTEEILVSNDNIFKCKYCSKNFKYKQGKWRHEKKCNDKGNDKDKIINTLVNLLNKNGKISPRQLQKINNMIQNQTNNMIQNQTNNNINITVNNPQIIELGDENIYDLLTKKQKIDILKLGGGSLDHLVKLVHCTKKYSQFNNIIITNIRNNQAYIYSSEFGKFILSDKNDILQDMISYRFDNIKGFYEEYEDKLPIRLKNTLEQFFHLKYNDKYIEDKCKEYNILLYNGCNKDLLRIKDDDEMEIIV
jgi:hypothetical protein